MNPFIHLYTLLNFTPLKIKMSPQKGIISKKENTSEPTINFQGTFIRFFLEINQSDLISGQASSIAP